MTGSDPGLPEAMPCVCHGRGDVFRDRMKTDKCPERSGLLLNTALTHDYREIVQDETIDRRIA